MEKALDTQKLVEHSNMYGLVVTSIKNGTDGKGLLKYVGSILHISDYYAT